MLLHTQFSSINARLVRQAKQASAIGLYNKRKPLHKCLPISASTMQPLTGNNSLPWPPHKPLAGSEPGSFAEGTITKRLPAILASTVSDLESVIAQQSDAEMQSQIRSLVSDVSELREEILKGGSVTAPNTPSGSHVPPQLHEAVQATQQALELWKARTPEPHTWLTLPWLLVECLMYVRLAVATYKQPLLAHNKFDLFSVAKAAAWDKCVVAAAELAESLHNLEAQLVAASDDSTAMGSAPPLKLALAEVMQWSLWGNKTDLSLLVDASGISPVSSAKQQQGDVAINSPGASRVVNPHVIVDEYDRVWDSLHASGRGRVDIILDNSGLELYGDLLLADFLITQGLADKVVLHGKPFPWFVSDTLMSDLTTLLKDIGPTSPVPDAIIENYHCEKASDEVWERVRKLGGRWAAHLSSGRWEYQDNAFWTTPFPYCWMSAAAPALHADLAGSNLVIWKGDLNYRKLTHDCRWPSTTPWVEALQGFQPAPMVALRTLKADVVAGLQPGQAEELSQKDAQWLVNGKWGMVQFCERK